jgi:hypothetical protein
LSTIRMRKQGYTFLYDEYVKWGPKKGTAVCGTARTVV